VNRVVVNRVVVNRAVANRAAVRDTCRRASEPAYRAAFFLPRDKRDGVYAVCAFAQLICEAIAPSAPGCCAGDNAAGGVADLVRERVQDLYNDRIELPRDEFQDSTQRVLAAMVDTLATFEIPRWHWDELIDGLVADAGVRRYATWRSLQRHAARTAGSVAAIVSCVLRVTSSDIGFIIQLGVATRLTNILASMNADRSHDHVYLPLEDLSRFRYSERELMGGVVNDNLRELVRFEVSRARELFRDGSAGLCWLAGDGSRMAAAAFVSLQTALLDAIERARFDIFHANLQLPLARQLRQLPLAWRLAQRHSDEAMPRL